MKLTEVKHALDAITDHVCRTLVLTAPGDAEHVRDALAEAFIAGVRSSGLKFRTDVQLWAACGCEASK